MGYHIAPTHRAGIACGRYFQLIRGLSRITIACVLSTLLLMLGGCFYNTRNYLRNYDPYVVKTLECTVGPSRTGTDVVVRFPRDGFAKLSQERPWLKNPVMIHLDQPYSPKPVWLLIISPKERVVAGHRDNTPGYVVEINGRYSRDDCTVITEPHFLPNFPLQDLHLETHDYEQHYTSHVGRYFIAPVYVLSDIGIGITTLGMMDILGCEKQDEYDANRLRLIQLATAESHYFH